MWRSLERIILHTPVKRPALKFAQKNNIRVSSPPAALMLITLILPAIRLLDLNKLPVVLERVCLTLPAMLTTLEHVWSLASSH
jgi:hypothetical protein